MAKTNKYASINFNHIYEKTHPTNPNPNSNSTNSSKTPSSSSPSYSAISSPNAKTHGRMLLLSRPTPKPIPTTPPPLPSQQAQQISDQSRPGRSDSGSDQISLRPLGSTGNGTGSPGLTPVLGQDREKEVVVVGVATSPKPNKFVPPHLRPGFVGKEERHGPGRDTGRNNFGSPVRYGEDGRPKSGGGHDRMRRGGELDRPNSSGWQQEDLGKAN